MPFHSPRDPDFWGLQPEYLQSVQDVCTPLDVGILHFVLGDPDVDTTPVAAMLKMPPNFVLPRHAHDCERLEMVVRGTLEVDGEILRPGDISIARPMEMYGPHVAGPEGCVTLEFFSSMQGVGQVILDTPDGPEVSRYLEPRYFSDFAGS
jgi:hypothetical protein